MWNDPWWRSLLHLLFVAITYGKVSLWLWKSLENSGNLFLLLCGHPVGHQETCVVWLCVPVFWSVYVAWSRNQHKWSKPLASYGEIWFVVTLSAPLVLFAVNCHSNVSCWAEGSRTPKFHVVMIFVAAKIALFWQKSVDLLRIVFAHTVRDYLAKFYKCRSKSLAKTQFACDRNVG